MRFFQLQEFSYCQNLTDFEEILKSTQFFNDLSLFPPLVYVLMIFLLELLRSLVFRNVWFVYIVTLVQDCTNSNAYVLELVQSCTKVTI